MAGNVRGKLALRIGLAIFILLALVGTVYAATSARANNVVIAAGDIADCNDISGAEATAAIAAKFSGVVMTLGDNVYNSGTAGEFTTCFDTTWGRFKSRIRPAVGNHEYGSPGAAPYFAYFGTAAGQPGQGWYSYDIGTWHIVVLNSNCAKIGGCGEGSPQAQWLKADLAAHPATCTLAYWHHPLYSSSGAHGNYNMMRPIWSDLYAAGADLVLNGHAHNYERLAPLNPDGQIDPQRGIREFVVGSGGRDHRLQRKIIAASEARNDGTYGVLKLTLRADGYDWEFIPVPGISYSDSGSGSCH